jgi:hypothetical protein
MLFEQLNEAGVRARIIADVEAVMAPAQAALNLGEARVNVSKVVDVVAAKVAELTIEIPEIVVLPTHDVTFGFRDCDLLGLGQSPSSGSPTRSRYRSCAMRHVLTPLVQLRVGSKSGRRSPLTYPSARRCRTIGSPRSQARIRAPSVCRANPGAFPRRHGEPAQSPCPDVLNRRQHRREVELHLSADEIDAGPPPR